MQTPNLDEWIRQLVREEVARALAGATSTATPPYTSLSLPPDCGNRSTFAKLAKKIPGATKSGNVWSVARESWAAFRNNAPIVKPVEKAADVDPPTDAGNESANEIARRSGLRLVDDAPKTNGGRK